MKTLLTLSICFIAITAHAQIKPFGAIGAGYASDHYTQLNFSFGGEYNKEEALFIPFAEAGLHLQLTNDIVTDIASINAGVKYQPNNFFISAKIGAGYCFNQQVKDVHKYADTTIVLSPGADKGCFFSVLSGAKVGYIIHDVPFYLEATYAGKITWISAGVEINF